MLFFYVNYLLETSLVICVVLIGLVLILGYLLVGRLLTDFFLVHLFSMVWFRYHSGLSVNVFFLTGFFFFLLCCFQMSYRPRNMSVIVFLGCFSLGLLIARYRLEDELGNPELSYSARHGVNNLGDQHAFFIRRELQPRIITHRVMRFKSPKCHHWGHGIHRRLR